MTIDIAHIILVVLDDLGSRDLEVVADYQKFLELIKVSEN